jgi:hypothetical protein
VNRSREAGGSNKKDGDLALIQQEMDQIRQSQSVVFQSKAVQLYFQTILPLL